MDSRRAGLLVILAFAVAASALALASVVEGAKCGNRGVSISVSSANDVRKRLNYPRTELVTLVLRGNPGPLHLVGAGYSCTVVRSAGRPVTVVSNDRSPALYVYGATDVLITDVNFRIDARRNSPTGCPAIQLTQGCRDLVCPAVSLQDSSNVMLTKALIVGRVELFKLTSSLVDSVTISGYDWEDMALRIGDSGDGPRHLKSNTVISNSNIGGSPNAIWLVHGAVGFSIINNNIHSFLFSGIRCGNGQHNVGDCMLTTIANNLIYTAPNEKKMPDNTGIYFATHWLNPGNYLSCNYIIGGEHCYYLDWASSGVTIDGGVCHLNRNGLKLNTGHSNKVSGLIISSPQEQSGWISCQNYWVNNCRQDPGTWWDSKRIQRYNSQTFQKLYPWLKDICTNRNINGISCNPAGSEPIQRTGACSGLPTQNDVTLTLVNAGNNIPGYRSCDKVTVIDRLNSLKHNVVSGSYPNFNRVGTSFGEGDDFGVPTSSEVFRKERNFKSCPRSAVGVKQVDPKTYYARL